MIDHVPDEPPAATAGEEDHSHLAPFIGDDADAPADTGTPPDDTDAPQVSA